MLRNDMENSNAEARENYKLFFTFCFNNNACG